MTDSSAWLIHDVLPAPARAAVMNDLFSRAGTHLDFLRCRSGRSDFTVGASPTATTTSRPANGSAAAAVLHRPRRRRTSSRRCARCWRRPPGRACALIAVDAAAVDEAERLVRRPRTRGSLEPWRTSRSQTTSSSSQAYATRGIPIAAITPQNDPQAGSPFPASSCPPAQRGEPDRPTSRRRSAPPAFTRRSTARDRGAQLYYPQRLLVEPGARRHRRHRLALLQRHRRDERPSTARLPGPEILSECSPGIIPYPVSEVAIDATRNWASAVGLWNLALDPAGGPVQLPNTGCGGCTGLVTIDEQTHTAALGLWVLPARPGEQVRGARRVPDPLRSPRQRLPFALRRLRRDRRAGRRGVPEPRWGARARRLRQLPAPRSSSPCSGGDARSSTRSGRGRPSRSRGRAPHDGSHADTQGTSTSRPAADRPTLQRVAVAGTYAVALAGGDEAPGVRAALADRRADGCTNVAAQEIEVVVG